MAHIVELKIAELFAGDAGHVIVTNGVGSCLVIVLHDPLTRVGGMAHAILPRAKQEMSHLVLPPDKEGKRFVKYVDQAIDTLIEELIALGAAKEHLVAKLIGGAHMFQLLEGDKHGIGFENVEVARERLNALGIPIETEVVGGTVGRNVRLDCATGVVEITTKI